MPEIQTISESGVPGYEGSIWWGILSPIGVSSSIVNKLNKSVVTILMETDTIKSLESQAAEARIFSTEEFRKHIADEIVKWRKVAKESGIDKLTNL
jgi:tripartite-type tricarboxylate transporter receptor subunit TctC